MKDTSGCCEMQCLDDCLMPRLLYVSRLHRLELQSEPSRLLLHLPFFQN